MDEPLDIKTPNEKSPVPSQGISIAIYVDLNAGPLPQSLLPPARMNVRSKFAAAFKNILRLSRPIGRLVFDILGRQDTADSSAVLLGWFVILLMLMLFRGFIPLDRLIDWLVRK